MRARPLRSRVAVTLEKVFIWTAAAAGASLLLWWGFCGPLSSTFDPPGGGYGPAGPVGQIGVAFFFAALLFVPLTFLLLIAVGVKSLLRRR